MNEKKLRQLFASARKETAPLPPPDFAADVLRAVQHAPAVAAANTVSLWAQLDFLFPRLTIASAAIVVACVFTDFGLTAAGLPELGEEAAQLSVQPDWNGEEL